MLKRPWRRLKSNRHKDAICFLKKRNYKVHAELGVKVRGLKTDEQPDKSAAIRRRLRYSAVLDTGVGPNLIRRGALPAEVILDSSKTTVLRNASNKPMIVCGEVELQVRLGQHTAKAKFYVVEKLATDVLLGCDYCDKYVEAIKPRKRVVEMEDGTEVPIIRKPSTRSKEAAPLPYEEVEKATLPPAKTRICPTKKHRLEPGTQTVVEVTCERQGDIVVRPAERLYETRQCLTANGVATVQPGVPFKVLVANFSSKVQYLNQGQLIAHADSHPDFTVDSCFTISDVLGDPPGSPVTSEDEEFRKPIKSMKRVARENKQAYLDKSLAELRAKRDKEEAEEPPMTVDDVDLSGAPEELRPRIRKMLEKYVPMWSGKLGEINTTVHRIDLKPGSRPVSVPPYRSGPKERELERAEVERQLKDGVIEPAVTEWASPVLFAPKADGTLRFCVDYRRLNEMTLKDSYPIPRMDECIDSLGDAVIFTTLDCNAGYWQVLLHHADRDKTAFVCHAGTFRYLRMPFGLTNAPATFQRTLDILLSKFKWQCCLVYLDDVIIHSRTPEEHLDHVDKILDTLMRAGVSLKLKKCSFFTDSVKYLGHIIRPGTLEVDKATTASLAKARPPTDQSEVRSFLGMCNVYRRFIPKYSDTAEPLNALLRAGQPKKIAVWTEKEETSFRTLLDHICNPPVLKLPKLDLPYTVDTDASAYQVGCTLFQTHPDGKRYPLGYWSRTLQKAERNYSASERECLAVVFALQTLRPYLLFEKFTVYTDHASLRWLLNIQEPSGRLMRWRLRLAEYDFSIEYKKGICNTQADALSRLRTDAEVEYDPDDVDIPVYSVDIDEENDDSDVVDFLNYDYAEGDLALLEQAGDDPVCAVPDEAPLEPLSAEDIINAQAEDEFCQSVRRDMNAGRPVPFSDDPNGILVRTALRHPQIVAPHVLRARILHATHYHKLAAHPGGRKLYQRLRRHFYWPAMAMDAYATVRKCVTCARNRIKLRKHASALKLFPAKAPLDQIAIDILGELIQTPRGNKYLLVMTDRYTKLTKVVALRGITAEIVAEAFVKHWILNYGAPQHVLSDNGPQFTARFFRETCRILGANNWYTTTYHPRTNGQVERYNSTIVRALRHYISDHPREWDLYVDALTYAYNCQPHSSTKIAPFELVLSNPPGPTVLDFTAMPKKTTQSKRDFRAQWQDWLRTMLDSADAALDQAQTRYKRNFDQRIRPSRMSLRPNRYAFLRIDFKSAKDDTRHKLAPLVTGPHRIVPVTDNTVVLELDDLSHERVSLDRVVPAPHPPGAEWTPTVATAYAENDRVAWPAPSDLGLKHLFNFTENPNASDQPTATLPPAPSPTTNPTEVDENLFDGEEVVDKTSPTPSPSEPTVIPITARRLTPPPSSEPAREQPDTTNAGIAEDTTPVPRPFARRRRRYTGPEHVIDRIVEHATGDGSEPSVPVGETRYRVRWMNCGPKDDTWHHISTLPRSAILRYVNRHKLPVPDDIDTAITG